MKRNVIEERRSIRRYKSKSVSRKEIEQLVEAEALAPSAKNRQPWKYVVYTGRETDCCQSQHSDFLTLFNILRIMKEAPVAIIVMNTNG